MSDSLPPFGPGSAVPELSALRRKAQAAAWELAASGQGELAQVRALVADLLALPDEGTGRGLELADNRARLDRARQLYFQHFAAAPFPIFRFDAEGGIREANLAGAALLGIAPEAIVRQPSLACLHAMSADGRVAFRTFLADVLSGVGPARTELALRDGRGQERCFEVRGIRVESATVDDHYRVVAYFDDVTGRRQAEAERARLTDVLEKFSTQVPGVLLQLRWWFDGRTAIPFASARFEQFFGLEPNHLREDARDVVALVHPEDRLEVRRLMIEAAQQLRPARAEFRLTPTGRPMTWVHTQAVPERLPDGSILWHAFVMDVTETRRVAADRQRLEHRLQQVQKLESLGVMAGGIAHDFNNLLTAMLGNASLALLEVEPTAAPARYLAEIEHAARRAAELTRQMLAYAGRARFSREQCDLNRLVREMRGMAEVSLSRKARLRLQLDPALPALEGDPAQLRQVALNLLINAAESLGENEGEVTVTTQAAALGRDSLDAMLLGNQLPTGSYVVLDISDTGCGMDEATLERIFDPFYTTKFTGRGLGLSAVLGIVRAHAGAIAVTSRVGQGSRFRVALPVASSPEARALDRSAPQAGSGRGLVLLVDDDTAVREIGRRALQFLGYQVIEADDGRAAVAAFRSHPHEFAAVILDLRMPHMDGVETLAALRGLRPDIPALLASGYGEHELESRYAGVTRAAFLPKPFDVSSLAEKLAHLRGAEG